MGARPSPSPAAAVATGAARRRCSTHNDAGVCDGDAMRGRWRRAGEGIRVAGGAGAGKALPAGWRAPRHRGAWRPRSEWPRRNVVGRRATAAAADGGASVSSPWPDAAAVLRRTRPPCALWRHQTRTPALQAWMAPPGGRRACRPQWRRVP
eukprot:TRINITY_DN6206_c0_g1_i1.p1 TRINITY_DN6206_c0_g1~~TRINITY_DN6206_c0_g1_i1.p1  ORF type:complete len:151 (+),score=5.28 TRINITY_DN6206_c0_g1_i1:99-551(+)